MAETIKGINVVIGAETTGLSKALSDVNKKSRDIQSELRQVEKLLKLDPGNTELLAQKQKLLANSVSNTQEKLSRLRQVQEQVNQQFARGDITEGQYRAFQREVQKTEQELRGLNNRLDETTEEIGDQGKKVSKLGQDYKDAFEQAKQSMGNSFDQMKKVGAGVTAFGTGLAAGLGVAVKSAADFEQGMANAYSVMDPAEVSKFKAELEQLAITMGAQTKYSATEAAQGIEELIKAGVKVQDVMSGGLSGALSLATAGELELADAAEIASTALNAFKSDSLSVQDAADILAGAANASATSVSELKFGLSQSASVAASVGLSFKDTATALAAFAQNGLKGSDAGTSLKTMLMRLQPTTADAYATFKDLGLLTLDTGKAMEYLSKQGIKPAEMSIDGITQALATYMARADGAKTVTGKYFKQAKEMAEANGWVYSSFYDANGSLKDMSEIAGLLNEKMSGLNDMQRQAAMNTMFGSDAIRAGNILYKEGAEGIDAMAAAMDKIDAQMVAAQKLDTLKGALEEMRGAMETAQITIGNALIPALRRIVSTVQVVIDMFNKVPEGTKSFIAVLGAITAALALIAGPLLILIGFMPQIAAGLTMLTPMFTALWTAITGPIGIVVAAIAAVAVGLTYLYKTNETVRDALNAAWQAIKSAAEAVFGALKSFWATWGGEITGLFNTLWNGIKLVFNTVFKAISEVVKSIFAGIKSFWATWGNDITAFFKAYWAGLSLIFNTVIKAILDFVRVAFNDIKSFWDKWGSTITAAFKGVFEILKTLFSATFTVIFTVIKTVFNNIKAFWDTWGATITTLFRTVFNVIKSVFTGVWNAIKIIVETVIGVISGIIKTWLAIFKGDWAGAWNAAKGVTETVWKGITGIFKNAFATMKDVGKNIIQGLVQGIGNMKDVVVQKAKEISEAIGGFFKKFFDIHSPSRLTTGYGENIGQGLANGISNKTKTAEKAAKETATKVNKAFKDAFATAQYNFKMGNLDTAGYVAALQKVKDQYAKTSAQVQKVTLEIKKAHEQQTKSAEKAAKDSFAASKAYIDARASTGKVTLEQELAMWEKVQAKYKAGTAQHIAAEKEAYKIKQELAKASFQSSKDYIEKAAAANEMSLTQQLSAWERVQARYKAGSDEAKAAEEAAGKVKLEIYNQLTQASEDFLAKTKEVNANVAAEELRLNGVYEQAVEQRAKAINDFAGLFDEVVAKSETSGQQLLDNLRGQVDYLATWASNIETLAARGIDKGLLEELRQMGPKAAPELAALNTLTDEQLAEYTGLWQTKSAESRAIAVQELTGLREDTDKQITQLRVDAATQLDGLKADFDAKVKAIRVGTTNQFNAMKSDLPNIGKQAMQGLLDGLSSMQGAVQAKAKAIADSVRTTMQKALDIHSPSREMAWIGEMAGKGLVQGMASMMTNVQRQAREMAEAVQPSVGSSSGGGADSDSISLNMEGLFSGAVFSVRSDEDIRSLAKELALEMFALTQQATRGTGGAR
ncbi:phage tail tape measure protein [Paenibacillus sp. JNUCC31]|uniref:phage tail tape measure protein n=1 Tax=Paenibacillus sp. JNUCC-31 TaxID=2777983 RepID=UPI00177AE924|nr:phage tail tape measure protein [Paenibacillus sp. JNUCC-31]QOS77997.1 phage tail tape measure protein [Paenibacillus sp. JNUCC-31]